VEESTELTTNQPTLLSARLAQVPGLWTLESYLLLASNCVVLSHIGIVRLVPD
jgi:hypothetical protein